MCKLLETLTGRTGTQAIVSCWSRLLVLGGAIGVCCDVSRRVAYPRLEDLVWLVFVGGVSLFASVSFHFSTGFSIIDACTKAVVGGRGEVSP
ncbi:hypothetical protein B296_00047789 [Ensete ventricosum]|uniref:Uncharacterized protein n=1 Tax=Ensete ventricosum TaxID=4639 RepID=A0A426XBY1_ENSVE|nr:hypothetical protein B296_00047789 [Ensete ventricosum]